MEELNSKQIKLPENVRLLFSIKSQPSATLEEVESIKKTEELCTLVEGTELKQQKVVHCIST